MPHPHYKTKDEWESDFLLAQERRINLYHEEVGKGYSWATNASAEKSKEFKATFENNGLEVLILDQAIMVHNGEISIIPGYKAILVKEKQGAQ